VLFQNVTVWTCGPAGVIEGGSVLISNGTIEAVYGPDDELPQVDLVVSGEGYHLTPGIIDCHSHMATDSGINEGSQAVTAEVRIGDFIDCDDITIFRQLGGGVTTANILHGSANPIGGQNQVIKLRWGRCDEGLKFAEAPQGIKFALGENVKRSNSRNTEGPTRYPASRMGVEQLMHDSFRAALEYKRAHEEWKNTKKGLPPRRDLEMDALVEILDGTRWIHCHSYRQDEILALIRVLDEYDVTIGTFQHILEGYKVAEKLAEHGAMASAFADWWAYKFEVYDAIPYAGALMHDAGVIVSFNSDDGELATHLNQEAAKAVRYGGVPPEEALKFVTLNPAKQLRIDQYVGSIEPGKHADVVLWNGPPLSAYSRVEQTWIDGCLYLDRLGFGGEPMDYQDMFNTLVQKVLKSGERMRPDDSRNDDAQNLWPRYDENCGAHMHGNDDQSELSRLQQAWEGEDQK
jgi:N-acetylglucosamine-6-phosphate deacetylase